MRQANATLSHLSQSDLSYGGLGGAISYVGNGRSNRDGRLRMTVVILNAINCNRLPGMAAGLVSTSLKILYQIYLEVVNVAKIAGCTRRRIMQRVITVLNKGPFCNTSLPLTCLGLLALSLDILLSSHLLLVLPSRTTARLCWSSSFASLLFWMSCSSCSVVRRKQAQKLMSWGW